MEIGSQEVMGVSAAKYQNAQMCAGMQMEREMCNVQRTSQRKWYSADYDCRNDATDAVGVCESSLVVEERGFGREKQ